MHTIGRFPIYALLFAALIFQVVLVPYIAVFGIEPDLIMILVVFFAVFLGVERGFEVGVVAGLMKDIFALDIFGINALVLSITGLLAGAINMRFLRESRTSYFILVLFSTVFAIACHFMISGLLIRSSGALRLSEYIFSSAIPTAVYTSLVSIPVFAKCIDLFELQANEDLL